MDSDFQNHLNRLAQKFGNAPNMEELNRRAKEEDDENSFFALISIHTWINTERLTDPLNPNDSPKFLAPRVEPDENFYKQDWVQKKLKAELQGEEHRNHRFREKFWNAALQKTTKGYPPWGDQQTEMIGFKDFVITMTDIWNEPYRKRK